MPSRTGYNDFKKAQYISRIQSDRVENELRRKKDKAEREAIKNTPEYKEFARKRALIQEETKTKEAEVKNEIENLEATLPIIEEDLVSAIKEDLNNLSVEEVLKKYNKYIASLEQKSDRLMELIKAKSPTLRFSYFAKFYYELSKINPQFIMHAPAKTFTYTKRLRSEYELFNLKALKEEDLKALYAKLKKEDESVFKDEHFKTYYSKYFKEEINHLKTLTDVKSCLVRYPEAYADLDNALKLKLKAKDEMNYVLTKAPSIIKFMSKEEIEEVANKSLKYIATAAMKEPEILDYLDEDFFSRHDYRLCFTYYSKAQIKATLGDKVKRHVRLQKFLNTKAEHRTLDQSLNF